MKKHIYTAILVAAAGSQMGSTDCGQVLRDPGFDLWCGDARCAWKVERGDVTRVPTWNAGDPGVELVGDDVAIEQLSPVRFSDGDCIEFDLVANIDPTAEVDFNVDVYGDGSVEHSERLPAANWKPLTYQLPIQGIWGGIRFELAKKGAGKAVLAQIEANIVQNGCVGLTPIVPAPAPLGAACNQDNECRSNRCGVGGFDQMCVGCLHDSDCASGDVCAVAEPTSPVYDIPTTCQAANSKPLGELCIYDRECASGRCGGYSCSTCKADSDCAPGEHCAADWSTTNGVSPLVCAPDLHVRTAGQPCASNADCASGVCNGTPRSQCDDGRSCGTAADCPFGDHGLNGLQNGPCNLVGVQGGTCQ